MIKKNNQTLKRQKQIYWIMGNRYKLKIQEIIN